MHNGLKCQNMARVRQLPELYLRGSLATQTMAKMSKGDLIIAEELLDFISKHPNMQHHKSQFIKELGITIAADYADDRTAAEAEYEIAIWRGICDLQFHKKYSFICQACNQSTYTTQRHKQNIINRVMTPCPNCKKVQIIDNGDTNLVIGDFVTIDEFQTSYKYMENDKKPPKCCSTIKTIVGETKYNNSDEILNDPKQLQKFFGEFVWNYFRQHLNENKRLTHRQQSQLISGPADEILLQEILSLCSRMNITHNYCKHTEPKYGKHKISIATIATPPEFTVAFSIILQRANTHNIKITFDDDAIYVYTAYHAPIIEGSITKPEHVQIMEDIQCIVNEDNVWDISQVSQKTIKGIKMDSEDHVDCVEKFELLNQVKRSLPANGCDIVFDILCQQGQAHNEFSKIYGDGEPKTNQIAAFLNTNAKIINNHKNTIQTMCLAQGLTPSSY